MSATVPAGAHPGPPRDKRPGPRPWPGVIEAYRDWLPLDAGTGAITLGEGGTPLVVSPWLSDVARGRVWLKVEGDNPTGSFKDRGMTVAISGALAEGVEAVVCASTRNTSASMTAYAARAGLHPLVLLPHGRIAGGKLAQTIVHGATVVQVRGNFDDCLRLARELADRYPVSLVNSVNPLRLEGQKTAAFEVVDALGAAPDIHVLPVGNAGNVSAYWQGYREYHRAGLAVGVPVMWGFQAEGAAPLVTGVPVDHPETVATAIRVGNPASWSQAIAARDESRGRIDAVTDAEIMHAQQQLALRDGVFVEPASAAGVAGLLGLAGRDQVPRGARIVVTVTGHGLKDAAAAVEGRGSVVDSVIDAEVDAAARAAGL